MITTYDSLSVTSFQCNHLLPRDWNVDLIPKFIMANGLLVKMLLHTKVTRYLEWKTIDCSYVMQHTAGGMFSSASNKIHKVPANEGEAIRSNLMGLFQKKKCRNFYLYMDRVNLEDQATWENKNLNTMTMGQVFESFGLDQQTTDFLGHAVALHIEDGYL